MPWVKHHKEEIPFYAWQCITISTVSRDLDLVIQDQQAMFDLLAIIINSQLKFDQNQDKTLDLKQTIIQEQLIKYKILKFRMKISQIALGLKVTIRELILC